MHSTEFTAYSELHESITQLADVWERIALDCGGGDIADKGGIAMRWADSDFPFFNTLTLLETRNNIYDLAKTFKACADYMKGREKSGLFWLFEDLVAPESQGNIEAMAAEAGMSLALTGYGMALDTVPELAPSHPELTFVRVETEEHLRAYADINCQAYAMPVEWGRAALSGSVFWTKEAYAYLGLSEGMPVSAAAVVEMNGCLFLALVATRPEKQRLGFGEATVRKALYEGRSATGISRSVLHATEAGRPVYERIGYHRTSTIRFLGLKR